MQRGRVVVQALLLAAMVAPSAALAQITTVSIRVDGLACPFCAYGLEREIKAVEGTKEPVINIEEGVVTFTPVGDVSIDFDGLRAAVKKAGFTPRAITVEGVGRVRTIDERATLVAKDGQQLFLLAANDVLASLQADAKYVVAFRGTLAPRENGDDAPLRTLALLSATPRATGDVD